MEPKRNQGTGPARWQHERAAKDRPARGTLTYLGHHWGPSWSVSGSRVKARHAADCQLDVSVRNLEAMTGSTAQRYARSTPAHGMEPIVLDRGPDAACTPSRSVRKCCSRCDGRGEAQALALTRSFMPKVSLEEALGSTEQGSHVVGDLGAPMLGGGPSVRSGRDRRTTGPRRAWQRQVPVTVSIVRPAV